MLKHMHNKHASCTNMVDPLHGYFWAMCQRVGGWNDLYYISYLATLNLWSGTVSSLGGILVVVTGRA